MWWSSSVVPDLISAAWFLAISYNYVGVGYALADGSFDCEVRCVRNAN